MKLIGLALTAALSGLALLGVANASATTLEIGGTKQNRSIEIVASLASGSSTEFESTGGAFLDTCTASEFRAKTEWFTASGTLGIGGKVSTLTFKSCTSTITVNKPGAIEISWIPGTTNGEVRYSQAEFTAMSPLGFPCAIQSNGSRIGTLLGTSSGSATLLINGVFSSVCGSVRWTGFYTVSSPSGLGVTE